jgi:hypothetical protein
MEPVIEPSACSAPVLRSESQRRPGRGIALKMVGELREVTSPRASTDPRRRSAPKSSAGWQLAQAVLPSSDTRVSQKRARPSAASGVLTLAAGATSMRPNISLAISRSFASSVAATAVQGTAATARKIQFFHVVFVPLVLTAGAHPTQTAKPAL